MTEYNVAVIGTGNPTSENGFAIAYLHGKAYRANDRTRLVSCSDILGKNADRYAEEFDLDDVYTDHEQMLSEVEPDIVSVCTPPSTHSSIVTDCTAAASVEAIHCEKPMADTWKNSQLMVRESRQSDVQLTFNHQRRFTAPWRKAKAILDEGTIGELERIEMSAPTLYDWGSHCFDLCHYLNDESSVEWVLGQIDYHTENIKHGEHNENQSVVVWTYENGVQGFTSTGDGADVIGCLHRLIGSEGQIEIMCQDGPDLRYLHHRATDWTEVECPDEDYWVSGVFDAIDDVVDSLATGTRSELSAENALRAMEMIFAAWESARTRQRIELPLQIDDNPLDDMVEKGQLTPKTK